MSWTAFADELWRTRPWMPPVLAALYLVPLLRFIGLPLEYGGRIFMRINRVFGKWEHIAWPLRDSVVALYLAGGALWHTALGMQSQNSQNFIFAFAAASLVALGWGMRGWRRSAHLRLIEFVRPFPTIHPQEFFDHLLCSSGAVRHRLPKVPFQTIDPAGVDFRDEGAGKTGVWKLAAGVWSTIWATRLALMPRKYRGDEFMREAASSLAVIWGARIGQLARARVTVEGKEKLPPAEGPQIFLFTHMSFLDFALAPLALAARPPPDNADAPVNNLPSFLLAKDHFRDNFLFYRILGIGRAAEALGMVFVDRRAGDKAASARCVAHEATSRLLSHGAPLAIFPQGTRAAPYVGPRGERRDAGYYTVGPRERIKADGKHLKKGAAHIATALAVRLKSSEAETRLRLIPIAVSGTAIAAPRGSMRILPNVHVRMRVGDPLVIDSLLVAGISKPSDDERRTAKADEYDAFVDRLHARIDSALKSAGRVHAELERRLFEDMRGMIEPARIEEVAIAMKPWRGEDYLVHAILDAIYACKPARWRSFTGELVHLLINFASREELLAFKGKVADAVPL